MLVSLNKKDTERNSSKPSQLLRGKKKKRLIYILFAASKATLAEEKNLFWESLNILFNFCLFVYANRCNLLTSYS